MPLISIVTILLRLFSLSWFVQGAVMFATVAAARVTFRSQNIMVFASPSFLVLLAILVFLFSQAIARLVTPAANDMVALGGIAPFALYCFALTFLGLYFILSSVGSALTHLHYYMLVARITHDNDPNRETSFYELAQPLITLAAGAACTLFAPRIARTLCAFQRKQTTV